MAHRIKVYALAKELGKRATDKIAAIYCITNTVNGKIYIGKSIDVFGRFRTHLANLRNTTHVNPHLQKAWDKYGETAFVFSVLEFTVDVECLSDKEKYYVDLMCAADSSKGYNLNIPTDQNYQGSHETRTKQSVAQKFSWLQNREKRSAHRNTPEYRQQMREAQLARNYRASPETRAKMSAASKGKKKSPEHRQALINAHKGWIPSQETREKIRRAHLGTKANEDTRIKMSAARKGKKRGPLSTEVKEKIAASLRGRKGHPHSAESKAKIAAATKRRHEARRRVEEE